MLSAWMLCASYCCRFSERREVSFWGWHNSVLLMRSHGRQMNMDYSLYWALRYRMAGIRRVIFFYDLMCQYWRNLMLRFRGNPFLSWPEGLEMVRAIGLFHVHGHVDQCYAWFAPSFVPGAGQVDGEILETLWSVLNISGPVT